MHVEESLLITTLTTKHVSTILETICSTKEPILLLVKANTKKAKTKNYFLIWNKHASPNHFQLQRKFLLASIYIIYWIVMIIRCSSFKSVLELIIQIGSVYVYVYDEGIIDNENVAFSTSYTSTFHCKVAKVFAFQLLYSTYSNSCNNNVLSRTITTFNYFRN